MRVKIAEKRIGGVENRRFASVDAAEPCVPTEDRGNEFNGYRVPTPAWNMQGQAV
jgi:hypothetical protein